MVGNPLCLYCGFQGQCFLSLGGDGDTRAVKQLEFKRRDLIYSCGAPAEGVYLVSKGSVSLSLTDARGHERIVQFVRAGELFGLDALSAEETRMTDALARECARVCVVSRAAFETFVRNSDERAWRLIQLLSGLAHSFALERVEISGLFVQERLKKAQARLERLGLSVDGAAEFPIARLTQRELSLYLGVCAETVSRLKEAHRKHLPGPSQGPSK